jgi:hypothetical protein
VATASVAKIAKGPHSLVKIVTALSSGSGPSRSGLISAGQAGLDDMARSGL